MAHFMNEHDPHAMTMIGEQIGPRENDDGPWTPDDFSYLLSEYPERIGQLLCDAGFKHYHDHIEYTPEGLEELERIAGRVSFWYEEYDEAQITDDERDHIWSSYYGLGGDDDVDYAGSYLSAMYCFLKLLDQHYNTAL